jgi:hypothetical protein
MESNQQYAKRVDPAVRTVVKERTKRQCQGDESGHTVWLKHDPCHLLLFPVKLALAFVNDRITVWLAALARQIADSSWFLSTADSGASRIVAINIRRTPELSLSEVCSASTDTHAVTQTLRDDDRNEAPRISSTHGALVVKGILTRS